MTDHHDFGDHHYDDGHHDEPVPFEPPAADDQYDHFEHHFADDEHGDHDELPFEAHETHLDEPAHEVTADADVHDTADPAPAVFDDATHDPGDLFPPAVDVGPLPEPVDGFPWIDTGSLGVVHVTDDAHVDEVQPQELAEYAGTDLPPGVDPWAALADNEDPATSALARFWSEN
jgi:hypothetical protein